MKVKEHFLLEAKQQLDKETILSLPPLLSTECELLHRLNTNELVSKFANVENILSKCKEKNTYRNQI
jgi:hypothetical protein